MDSSLHISRAKTFLLLQQPFFASLILRMPCIESNSFTATATDGSQIFFNPDYIEKLSTQELAFVLAHEVMHIALHHHLRRKGRDDHKWNVATDYAINPLLLEAGLHPPDKIYNDPAYAGQTAEEIYDQLPDNPAPEDSDATGDPNIGEVLDIPDAANTHLHAQEIDMQVKQAATVARQQGRLPAFAERLVEQILHPRIDWRAVLSYFLTEKAPTDYSWSRPNPRYACSGLYLPVLHAPEGGSIALIVDTSGSIDQAILDQFGSEIQAIAGLCQLPLLILYVDTVVAGHQWIDPGEICKLTPKGGGGTDFRPGFDWLFKEGLTPTAIVYLTDGECSNFPLDTPCPVLWALISSDPFFPPFGEVIRLSSI